MALLDAVLCSSDSISNCYSDSSAISIGIGMMNGTLINWNGIHWHQATNTTQVLINDQNSVITELWTTDQTWAITGAPSVIGKANNGLYFTNATPPLHSLCAHFGVCGWNYTNMTNWANQYMNSTNICKTKGMRLPIIHETSGWAGLNGVSCSYSYCQTAQPYDDGTGTAFWVWGTSGNAGGQNYNSYYVICVR